MNWLYKFRGTINSTSSLRMPKPALITKKSGSIWFEHSDYMNDLTDSDDAETVDPIWMFGYRFHEKVDEGSDNDVIFLERIGPEEEEEEGERESEEEEEKDDKRNPKKNIQQLAPIESVPITSVILYFILSTFHRFIFSL